MLRFLDTLFRHRGVLIAPVVVGVLVAMGLMFVQPALYESTGSLFVDTTGQERQALLNPYATPADNQAASLRELIATKAFCGKVAQRSGLEEDLVEHGTGTGIVSSALAFVHASPARPRPTDQQVAVLDYDAIFHHAKVEVAGPTVIKLSFRYRSPAVAQAVVKGIMDQFMDEVRRSRQDQSQATVDFYLKQLPVLKDDVNKANSAVTAYVASHPETRSLTAVPDPTLADLQSEASLARTRFSAAQAKLDEARSQVEMAKAVAPAGLRIMDHAELPLAPLSAGKAVLTAVGGGLAVSVALIAIGVLILTALDATVRRPSEVEDLLGRPLLAVIPEVGR